MQVVIRRQAAEQLSNVQLREWQRYRGWTMRILEELEHSGGLSTRAISDAIGYKCVYTGNLLRRMLNITLVERVERWGWRITRDGIFLLSLNYACTTHTHHTHNACTTHTQEKSEPAPMCFALPTCHIKHICQDKRYTKRNMALCNGTAACIWGASGADRAPVEMKVRGA